MDSTTREPQSLTEAQQHQAQDSATKAASNIFDQLIAQSIEKNSSATTAGGTSHPQIFRKGTLIDIPDESPSALQDRRTRRKQDVQRKQRLVAICIKDDAQAQPV
ncbi:hypothetical protein LPJ57_003619, partial [Coemansia sp. RSA 486]